jgi:hypothetical protein
MKSQVLRRNLRKSCRRKIQKGGMKIEEATRLLHEYGCSFMDTVAIASAMTNKGVVNDTVFHATIFLRTQHKKSWTDAVTMAVLTKGDMNQIKILLALEAPKKKKTEPPFYLARPK